MVRKSPWAKLAMRWMPKISVAPTPARARIEPVISPLTNNWASRAMSACGARITDDQHSRAREHGKRAGHHPLAGQPGSR